MIENEFHFIYPDDDGIHTRPWIVDGDERCCDGCQRVVQVMKERPWVTSEVFEVPMNSTDDENGVDLFVPMNKELVNLMGIRSTKRGIPFQIKSSYKACLEFAHKHEIYKRDRFVFEKGEYIFILNGTDAKELVMADIVGQIVALTTRRGQLTEQYILEYLANEMNDTEIVERYLEHMMIVEEHAWYSKARRI